MMPGPKVKTCEGGGELEQERQTQSEKGVGWGGGGQGSWLTGESERERERQPIRLGDDSPMLDIYSIGVGGGSYVGMEEPVGGRANGLGGGQDGITVPSTGSGGGKETAEIRGARKGEGVGKGRQGGWGGRGRGEKEVGKGGGKQGG